MNANLQTVAAVLTALGAFVGALVLAYRGLSGDRFSRKVSESAALLTGYTEMVKNLRTEITEIRADHDKEVERNKRQCQEDMERLGRMHKYELDSLISIYAEQQKQWAVDRNRLMAQIDLLNERIDELGTQVYVLQNRPPESRDRKGDVTRE